MDKQRTENMASDDAEKFIRDARSVAGSKEDNGFNPAVNLRESEHNAMRQESNKHSQKNAEHDAKYGDASDAERSRLPKYQRPEDAHVPQG